MGDLKDPRLMYLKAGLFLLAGCVAAATIFVQNPTLITGFLLVITIWSFCRLYYFMFYVVQHYVDDSFRFSGIIPFVMYVLKAKCGKGQ